jgi:hypothetical protein
MRTAEVTLLEPVFVSITTTDSSVIIRAASVECASGDDSRQREIDTPECCQEKPSVNQEVLERVRAEYLEMPGMRLTSRQVQRLCGVEVTTCASVLNTLVARKFLCQNLDGTYARSADRTTRGPRRAQAA